MFFALALVEHKQNRDNASSVVWFGKQTRRYLQCVVLRADGHELGSRVCWHCFAVAVCWGVWTLWIWCAMVVGRAFNTVVGRGSWCPIVGKVVATLGYPGVNALILSEGLDKCRI